MHRVSAGFAFSIIKITWIYLSLVAGVVDCFPAGFPVSARDGPRFITLLLHVFRRSSLGALNLLRGSSYREIITVILSETRKVQYE